MCEFCEVIPIAEEGGSLLARLGSYIARGLTRAKEALKVIGRTFASGIRNLGRKLVDIFTGIGKRVRNFATKVRDVLVRAWEGVKNFFKRIWPRGNAGSKADKVLTATDVATNIAWIAHEVTKNRKLRSFIKKAGDVLKKIMDKIPLVPILGWTAGLGLAIYGAKELAEIFTQNYATKYEIHKNDKTFEKWPSESKWNRYSYPDRNAPKEVKDHAKENIKKTANYIKTTNYIPYPLRCTPGKLVDIVPLIDISEANKHIVHKVFQKQREHVDNTARQYKREGRPIKEIRDYVRKNTKQINSTYIDTVRVHTDAQAYNYANMLYNTLLPYYAYNEIKDYENRGLRPPEYLYQVYNNPIEYMRQRMIPRQAYTAVSGVGALITNIAPVLTMALSIILVVSLVKELKHVIT